MSTPAPSRACPPADAEAQRGRMPGHRGVLRLWHLKMGCGRNASHRAPQLFFLGWPALGGGHRPRSVGVMVNSEGFSPRQGGEQSLFLPWGPWRVLSSHLSPPGWASPPSQLPPVLARVLPGDPRDFLEAEPHGPLREMPTQQPASQTAQSFRSRDASPGKGAAAPWFSQPAQLLGGWESLHY